MVFWLNDMLTPFIQQIKTRTIYPTSITSNCLISSVINFLNLLWQISGPQNIASFQPHKIDVKFSWLLRRSTSNICIYSPKSIRHCKMFPTLSCLWLCVSDQLLLHIQKSKWKLKGNKAFSIAAPSLWNKCLCTLDSHLHSPFLKHIYTLWPSTGHYTLILLAFVLLWELVCVFILF